MGIFSNLKDENSYKNNQNYYIELFPFLLVFILQIYALLVPFKGFLVFEIRKNLDLRKILVTPKIFLKSRFHCTNYVATSAGRGFGFQTYSTNGNTANQNAD